MTENLSQSLISLDRNDLIRKISADPGSLRKAISEFVDKIAPKYECPDGLGCHVLTPNRNCFYWEGIEENIGYYTDEIENYEDSSGFCPLFLDFIFFVSNRLKENQDFSKEKHDCDLWTYNPPIIGEYYEAEFKNGKKISEKHYVKCVICGRECVRVNQSK